jgi:soluble lytic murein transglycosylase-like protein
MPDIEIFQGPIKATTYLKPAILELVDIASKKHALDFWTLVAQVEKESSGNPNAIRLEEAYRWFYPSGSKPEGDELEFQRTSWGLLQIMGATARELGYTEAATPWPSSPLKSDPAAALDLGCRYLVGMLRRHGNIADALSAYNAGSPSKKNRAAYVEPILKRAEALKEVEV